MANNSYGELFDLIREKCQRENWYGPDGDNIYQYGEKYRRRRWYDWERNFHVVDKENDPLRFGFEYPPATEEQLLATEKALGFPLPPALRALYLQVANGGFGPGYGIIGAKGGFPHTSDGRCRDIADGYHAGEHNIRYIDFATHEKELAATRQVELPLGVYPDRFLFICYWGCGIGTDIDCNTGRIFQGQASRIGYYVLEYRASSLEEWLQQWLKGENLQ